MNNLLLGKWVWVVLVAWGLCVDAMAGDAALRSSRSWLGSNGGRFEGRVLQYDASRDLFQFEDSSLKRFWLTPDKFCEKDQKYLSEWIVADAFISSSKLKISIDKDIEDEKTRFDLVFENKSPRTIPGFKLEYKFHVEVEVFGGEDSEQWSTGSTTIATLAPGEEKAYAISCALGGVQYKDVTVFNSDNTSSRERRKVSSTYVRGVLMRMTGPTLGGITVVRELSEPASLGEKYAWDKVVDTGKRAAELQEEKLHEQEKELRRREKEYAARISASEASNEDPESSVREQDVPAHSHIIDELTLAAREGDSDAMIKLGSLYEKGEGTPVDYRQAIEWYITAGRSNNLEGCVGLAGIYASCDDPAYHDGAKAVKFAEVVARKSPRDAGALLLLSAAYMRNWDQSQAVTVATKAAGFAESLEETKKIQSMIENLKQGIPVPPLASVEWLEAAKRKGNRWAGDELLSVWSNPEHAAFNIAAARRAYEKRIASGDTMAWVGLGDVFFNAADSEQGMECYEKAKRYNDLNDLPMRVKESRYLGYSMREVLDRIGSMRGQPVKEQNQELIVFLYELAIQEGFVAPGVIERYKADPDLFGLSFNQLISKAHQYFEAVEYEKYVLYMTRSHDAGYDRAASFLGYLYIYRTEEKSSELHDIDKGLEWFERGIAMRDEHCFRGMIQFYDDWKDQSLRDYEKAAAYADLAGDGPWGGSLVMAQTVAYERANQYEKAIERLEKWKEMSLEEDPKTKLKWLDNKLATYREKLNAQRSEQ